MYLSQDEIFPFSSIFVGVRNLQIVSNFHFLRRNDKLKLKKEMRYNKKLFPLLGNISPFFT